MEDSNDRILFAGLDFAHEQVEGASYPFPVAKEISNVVLVTWAQSHIDNGGLPYFFEMEAPGAPPYAAFADAYREIGASGHGNWIIAAAAKFPFPDAHLRCDERCEFMYPTNDSEEFGERFQDQLFDNLSFEGRLAQDIWEQLTAYIKTHKAIFLKTKCS